MDAWMVAEVEALTARFGTVPPPWVVFPEYHPYSLFWRMGGGESLIMVWGAWWREQAPDEASRVAYFRRFPPRPRWLRWTIRAVWASPPGEGGTPGAAFDEDACFARAAALGLGSREAYERDLRDSDDEDGEDDSA